MEIEFFNADELDRNLKCSIHKTGKLGFSGSAIEKLEISANKTISIGKGKDEELDVLYIKINEGEEKGAFNVSKAGDYYYLNTKVLFDKLGIDYRRKRIIYDIVEIDNGDGKLYKLIKREISRKETK